MGTGLASVVLSLLLGQAPPTTMAAWKAKWMDAPQQVVLLDRDPTRQIEPYMPSRWLAQADMRYISVYGSPADAIEANRALNSFGIVFYFAPRN